MSKYDEQLEARRRQYQAQQGVTPPCWNEPYPYGQWPPNQLQPAQPPGYSPLSEADVQRIAEAVVARLKTDWLQR